MKMRVKLRAKIQLFRGSFFVLQAQSELWQADALVFCDVFFQARNSNMSENFPFVAMNTDAVRKCATSSIYI